MTSVLFNLMLITASIVSFVCIDIHAQADDQFASGSVLYENQNYKEALAVFESCVESDSTNLNCIEKAGLSAYRLGDIPLAKQHLLQLLKIDTFNSTALIQLSSIYEQEKNTPKAIKYYTALKKQYPQNSIYCRKLGQQYQSAGLLTDAFANFAEALKLNDRDLFTIKGIAEIFLSNKQYYEADSIIRKGLDLDSMNVNFNLLIAQSKYRQKSFDSTVHYLERIKAEIDLSPYFNKLFGYSYIQIDSFEHSIPLLEKALVDEGNKEYAHYYLAIAYENLDNQEYALHHYGKALEEGISENVDLYHRNLAKIYNEKSKLRDAIDHYKDAYKYGKDPLILFFLARACDKYYKDRNIAVNYYQKYIKSGDENEEYIRYAKERKRYLIEQIHFEN
jgi:tetratricopeptide (TPR) repeat protein